MADDLVITGTTVGDISYVVAYYDVNTGNLYDANGNMYGNSTLTTTLDNEFILELHYVQDISTDSDPTTWAVWGGLEGKTVDSSLAFDSDYKHAYEGASTESTAAASHEIKVTVSSVDKDTLNSEGNLIINPYGLEPEQIPQGSTSTPRMVVPYDSFEYVSSTTSGTVFKFHVADPDGLMYAVPANIQVRVSDPLYLYINPSSIYEVNIPPRYNEGVFKFPMNIMSRKLLKALDYTGVSGVVGTLEHKISVRRDTLTGVSYNSNTYTRDKDKDSTAVYSGDTFLFCAWVNGSSTIWTKGNDVQTNTAVYSISNGTATLLGSTANPVTETDSVLFRTFAFPFLVKNLIDYNATIDIPMQDVDWAKDYIISIIKNNMEEVTGKASTGAYGVVKIANDGTIDVDDGVISIATSLATKQDNMSAIAPVAINNSTVSLNFGDGLAVGVTGTTNANKLIVNEASVKEVLEDVVDGGTEPAVNEIVTADNLRGALSVGQAVDVTCCPNLYQASKVSVDGGTTWTTITSVTQLTEILTPVYLESYQVMADTTGVFNLGFNMFPKYAPNLKYLFIVDVKLVSGSTTSGAGFAYKIGSSWYYSPYRQMTAGNTYRFYVAASTNYIMFNAALSANAILEFSNYRQYEVTALTDEAIAYIAQLPNPDAFFRSTDAYSIRDKYLIKQDMVCPFIPTIEMSNSDLTVAAGLAYKMTYKSNTATTHTITADTIPTLAYGWDTHLQLFVDDNTTVNFQYPLVLEDPLTPNAGHNMTIKWRNGQALAYVDDTDVGYIVTVAAGTENGSLYYGLTNDVGEYITFANTTDGTPINIDGGTINVTTKKNTIGNGTENTDIVLSTISLGDNLNINNTSLKFISNDNNGIIGNFTVNLNNVIIHDSITYYYTVQPSSLNLFNCIISGNTSNNRSIIYMKTTGNSIVNTQFINNSGYAAVVGYNGKNILISNCLFSGNTRAISLNISGASGSFNISGSTFATSTDTIDTGTNTVINFSGTNILNSIVFGLGMKILSVTSNLDLSENSTSKVITGGTITAQSGAQVIPYGETEPVAVEGTGNTLLNNGRLGYLVSNASGTTATGTLYDALAGDGADYSNVIFDPALDGQVCALVSGTSIANEVLIDGNGTNSTYLTDFPSHTGIMTVRNVKITGRVVGSMSGTSGTSFSSNRWENILIDGNNYLGLVCWRGAYNRISNCTITANNDSKDYCFSIGNTSITDCKCYTKFFGRVSQSNSHGRFTNCLFAYAGTVDDQTDQIRNNSNEATVHLSGCTFNQYNNIYIYGTTSHAQFEDTNIMNGTVYGVGTVTFADGATVTSTIPSGSTIGTGVFNIPIASITDHDITVTLSNITFTNISLPTGDSIICSKYPGYANIITIDNVNITAITCDIEGFFAYCGGTSDVMHLSNVTVSGNTNLYSLYAYNGIAYIDGGCKFLDSAGVRLNSGKIVLTGTNTVYRFSAIGSRTGKVVFTPDSITTVTQDATFTSPAEFVVGTIDSSGNITVTGTATVILAGVTKTVAGSGSSIGAITQS